MEIIALYEGFRERAEQKRRALFREHREFLKKLSASLTERSIFSMTEDILDDLAQKEIISPKLLNKLQKECF